jgi:hypothetical protein
VGGRRVVVIAFTVDRPARVRLRLLKAGKVVAGTSYRVPKGRNTVRLGVPAKVKPGTYVAQLRITSGSSTLTLRSPVRVRR